MRPGEMTNDEIPMTNATRMTNDEILMTNQCPNDPMTKKGRRAAAAFVILASSLIGHSCFVIRHFPAIPWSFVLGHWTFFRLVVAPVYKFFLLL